MQRSKFATAAFSGLLAASAIAGGNASATTSSISISTAGTKRVGQTTYAWGTANGAATGTKVCTQVLLKGAWSTSQCATTDARGYYTIPLTYGASTPGSYTFRVTSADGATSRSAVLVRTASTGVHTTEAVVSTASSTAVPNRFVTAFPSISAQSPSANIIALNYLLRGAGESAPAGSATYASSAIKSYQIKHALPGTGNADPATVSALSTTLSSGSVSARTQAAQVLLAKHGYTAVNSMTYGTATDSMIRAFQAGHGIVQTNYVGNRTWATLFAGKTSGPLYPLMQAGTGAAQWSNCGPASAVAVELYKGLKPQGWDGDATDRASAINYFRYTQAGVPNNSLYNEAGTTARDIVPAFGKVGISSYSSNTGAVEAAAKAGKPSVAGGDAYQLPWNRGSVSYVHGPASHFIAVLGWDGTNFIVIDPISTPGNNVVHLLTPAQLTNFGATAPGWGPGVLGNDVPPSLNNIVTR